MEEKEIQELIQRFYSLYCNCPMRDERMIYLDISNRFQDLLDIKRLTFRQNRNK